MPATKRTWLRVSATRASAILHATHACHQGLPFFMPFMPATKRTWQRVPATSGPIGNTPWGNSTNLCKVWWGRSVCSCNKSDVFSTQHAVRLLGWIPTLYWCLVAQLCYNLKGAKRARMRPQIAVSGSLRSADNSRTTHNMCSLLLHSHASTTPRKCHRSFRLRWPGAGQFECGVHCRSAHGCGLKLHQKQGSLGEMQARSIRQHRYRGGATPTRQCWRSVLVRALSFRKCTCNSGQMRSCAACPPTPALLQHLVLIDAKSRPEPESEVKSRPEPEQRCRDAGQVQTRARAARHQYTVRISTLPDSLVQYSWVQ